MRPVSCRLCYRLNRFFFSSPSQSRNCRRRSKIGLGYHLDIIRFKRLIAQILINAANSGVGVFHRSRHFFETPEEEIQKIAKKGAEAPTDGRRISGPIAIATAHPVPVGANSFAKGRYSRHISIA
ncbi:hypothetical protein [Pseudomonas sp. RC10]|uniref:hypothetical protein n=1 Tax=Pseudomonas bambusae TaxID=3139142 RepID=UPI003138F0FF